MTSLFPANHVCVQSTEPGRCSRLIREQVESPMGETYPRTRGFGLDDGIELEIHSVEVVSDAALCPSLDLGEVNPLTSPGAMKCLIVRCSSKMLTCSPAGRQARLRER